MRVFIVFGISLLLCFDTSAQKQMAVTVDDLPAMSKYYTGKEGHLHITRQLLAHFARHRIPAVGFVIGGQLRAAGKPDTNQLALLSMWLDAGLELGNHTFAHRDYNNVAFATLKTDVLAGEAAIKPHVVQRGRRFRYFRTLTCVKAIRPPKKIRWKRF